MVPITKNIIVVDEFGKEYTSTYAKRAKGLVKNGRARWLDGNNPLGGEDGAQRARAINNIYSAREVTNQKLIDLLEKMYNNIAQ